ncbi:hypothetical protein [Prochlorococcus sp. SS52]|uniref:hypothetical protein n=1 Tax=Prochlorococcus sp. SS52 TaxID=1499501 RepID=UPI000533848F|nr:hypothetical protein [Prochlorococcus sp. SS52]KGG37003.1 hypothetical protein EV11_0434 [Prochlorococcus sp. SS52]
MSLRILIAAFALGAGFFFSSIPSISETSSSEEFRVLAKDEIGLSLNSVEKYLSDGDEFFARGDFDKARKKFDKAREMSKLLLGFYRDLGNSFKGIDARIPREMDSNSRKVLSLISRANLKLAILFRKTNRPELAVPLLVEVVRISSPANLEGQEAYQTLVELGFVNTTYRGARKRL